MLIEPLSVLMFPKLHRPGPVNPKADRDRTVPAETTSAGSLTPPSSTPEASPTRWAMSFIRCWKKRNGAILSMSTRGSLWWTAITPS